MLVAIPTRPPMVLRTPNFSKSGIFVLYGAKDKPVEGTEIRLTLKEFLGHDVPMAMVARIVYMEETGLGIEFIGPVE